jgi:hypothetical protein
MDSINIKSTGIYLQCFIQLPHQISLTELQEFIVIPKKSKVQNSFHAAAM